MSRKDKAAVSVKWREPEFYIELKIEKHVVEAHTKTIVLGNYFPKTQKGIISKEQLEKGFLEGTNHCISAKVKRIKDD